MGLSTDKTPRQLKSVDKILKWHYSGSEKCTRWKSCMTVCVTLGITVDNGVYVEQSSQIFYSRKIEK